MVSGKKKILIVGAGASGLPSIRHALFYNADVVCFEGSGEIGGLWNYKPHETDLSSVMKSTVINSSKEMTAYSDFPPEGTMANFMHNREMYRYLKNYAKHFELEKYIKLHHKVISIDRAADYEKSGKWNVKYSNEKGTQLEEVFDGVLLCNGHHTLPHWPTPFPGQDQFKGRIIHSHSYKDHRGFEDKIVVVVGVGNSGGDVAVELSRIARQVYLVTRRGTWVINRIFDFGQPVDLVSNKKSSKHLRGLVPVNAWNAYMEYKLNSRFDHKAYGLKPKHGVFCAHPTVNDELPNRIACGTIKIKPNIKKFGEHSVEFEDGSILEHVDEVVMCTGFSFEFNLVENGKLISVDENHVNLYKNMYPIDLASHNSFAIIGLVQPLGSIMPLSEMQARVYFEALFGKIDLPSKVEMENDVKEKREAMARRYVPSRRHTIQKMLLLILFTGTVSIPILLWLYSWYIAEIPKYYTKRGTKLHSKVEKNLRILHQLHHPSWWCPFGSAQTVVRELFRNCPQLPFEREIVEFEDGGAAGIDWLIPEGADETAPIVVFLPGIAGSTHDSSYLLHTVIEARDKGWKCLVVNPRGLSGVKLRTTRSYSAAATEDFSFIAEMVHDRFPNARKLGCGFSAGGIILYNYLAKAGENSHIDGGMAVSSPWDINITALSLEEFIPNLLFNRFIVKNLVNIVASHQELFENCEDVDFKAVINSKTLRQFENSFIVPTFKYKNCQAYYDDAAMRTKVHRICRPMVTLNAADDCFSPIEGIPIGDIENSEHVISIITNHGGHTAFMESADPNARGLVEKLLSQWGNLVFHDYP